MESQSRGGGVVVNSRVTSKLAADYNLVLPYRSRLRAGTGPRDDILVKHLLETSSLSGTTAPSSPTLADSPATAPGPSLPLPTHKLLRSKSSQYLRRDALEVPGARTLQVPRKSLDKDDAPSVEAFRRHHRGIGSIDSMLSSTTCVNTQSECSRPASRVSRTNRYEADSIAGHPFLDEVAKYAYDEDSDDLVLIDSVTPTRGTHFVPTTSPAFSPTPIAIHNDCEGEDEVQEETRVVNEISSWVLRSLWGKEVDECVAPLLVSDCTQRYLQELYTAAKDGNLRNAAASPEQAGTSPGSGLGGGGSPPNSGSGKGKRKADSGNEDGDGYGDEAGKDGEGNMATGIPRPAARASNSCNFSCPYRKRNPRRFNVRDYYVCATHSFADMSQLKKHIRAHHPPVQRNAGPFSCPRCFQGFPTKNDLDDHLRAPDVCRITFDQGGADPEDGITQKIIVSLEARTLKLKIDNWVSLWKLLFPADKMVPDPTFVPVMEVFDFVAESKKFLDKLRELLELQYRYVLEGADQSADVERKIHQGLDRSTQSFYNWVEIVIQDWEQRFTGAVSMFSQLEALTSQPADEAWTGASQLLPPSPALTPTVAATTESAPTSAATRDDSPESTSQSSVSGATGARRTNPTKRIRRSDAVPKTQLPVPIQKARTPQPQSRTPSSSLRRPSGVPVLATQPLTSQPPATLPPNPPIHNPRPSYPQHWTAEYPQVSSPYGPPYTVMASSPGIPAPQYPTSTIPQSPFLPSEPTTPADQHPQQQQPQLDCMHPDPAAPPVSLPDSRHSSTIRASRFLGSTPRSSLTSEWVRDPTNLNANRDSAQTLVDVHPPGPCQNLYCPSCSKMLPDGMGHPGVQHTAGHGNAMFDGGMVGMGHGFGMGVVSEEHGGYPAQGEWYGGMGVGVQGGGGIGGGPGGMFNGMQEGF
ncbi:hypothetical protein QBC47DRAFT_455681 [Echria macrotheca]|uniref:C2H2-type domain-containing protein n=1 Tax=Echria macrotheca TaxID=438768 RepID=A0AAJ0F3Z0_9PEZI|nr:hypothetical protein QBC47DRAFT_455681 [Echria macrotheca]